MVANPSITGPALPFGRDRILPRLDLRCKLSRSTRVE